MSLGDPEIYRLARRFRQMAAEVAGLGRLPDLAAVLRGMLRLTRMTVPFDAVLVAASDPDEPDCFWVRLVARGSDLEIYPDLLSAPRDRGGFLASVLHQGEPLLIDRPAWGEDSGTILPWLRSMQCALVVPTTTFQGPEMVQVFFGRRTGGFQPRDLRQAVIMGNLVGALMSNLILRERLDAELTRVGQVQRSLLPAGLPTIPGWDLAVHYAASTRSGGDAYDFLPRPDGSWALWVSDASGHGASAAVVMAMTRVALHEAGVGLPGPADPAGLLERVGAVLSRHLTAEQFVTAWAGVLDPSSGRLSVGTAGHPTPRWWRAERGRVEPLPQGDGLPLGLLPAGGARPADAALRPGDVVLAYTDGVTEAFNTRGELFGLGRLDRALANASGGSAASIRDALVSRLNGFAGRRPLEDDATLVVLRRLDPAAAPGPTRRPPT